MFELHIIDDATVKSERENRRNELGDNITCIDLHTGTRENRKMEKFQFYFLMNGKRNKMNVGEGFA